jgi:hypothetical protein
MLRFPIRKKTIMEYILHWKIDHIVNILLIYTKNILKILEI